MLAKGGIIYGVLVHDGAGFMTGCKKPLRRGKELALAEFIQATLKHTADFVFVLDVDKKHIERECWIDAH